MISTTTEDVVRELEFVQKAAAAFAKYPDMATYMEKLKPGGYIALRWGVLERGVLLLKLDSNFVPINYRDAIAQVTA